MRRDSGDNTSPWHILGDALEAIKGGTIVTMDGQAHDVGRWDLLIAHPPCTYLSKAGGNRLRINGEIQIERYKKGIEGAEFFLKCLNADILLNISMLSLE